MPPSTSTGSGLGRSTAQSPAESYSGVHDGSLEQLFSSSPAHGLSQLCQPCQGAGSVADSWGARLVVPLSAALGASS